MSTWYIGAIINVVGSILINLGTNVMKLGHNKRSAASESNKKPIRKYREWQCGVLLFAIGNGLNFASFGFAAQSLLSALGSIQFVSNVFFARFVLHEKAERRAIVATAMIVVGCIVLVVFGNHQSRTLTVEELLHYFRNDFYLAYLAWLVVVAGISYLVYRYGDRKLRENGLAGMSNRLMKVLPISYALYSGMIGTQSVLFSKALSTLLRTTIDGDSQLDSWLFWVVLLLFACCAYFWVMSLNKALRLFPAVIIVPTMQISWTLFSVISGGIYYQEYKAFTPFTAGMFALGVLIIFVAVYLLAGHSERGIQPVVECTDTECAPCGSRERPVSRTSSALPLSGFLPHPEDLMSCQWVTAMPRHARFYCPATDTSTVVARCNSDTCDRRNASVLDEAASAGSQTAVMRTQSMPMSPRTADAAFKAKLWDIELAVPSPRATDSISTTPTPDLPTDTTQDQLLAMHQPRS